MVEIQSIDEVTATARSAVETVLQEHGRNAALACSFSPEDVIVAHLMLSVDSDARIFAIDTGRLPEETYQCADALRRMLEVDVEWYFPKHEDVESIIREKGPFSFYESLENRRECCHVRKVEPLNRALSGLSAWLTGMRREQSVTRSELAIVETDAAHGGIVKVNPLADWTMKHVDAYMAEHGLPVHRLYRQGFPSIGCAPCTRAVQPGADPRSGRWWWEDPDNKECGLHVKEQNGSGI